MIFKQTLSGPALIIYTAPKVESQDTRPCTSVPLSMLLTALTSSDVRVLVCVCAPCSHRDPLGLYCSCFLFVEQGAHVDTWMAWANEDPSKLS